VIQAENSMFRGIPPHYDRDGPLETACFARVSACAIAKNAIFSVEGIAFLPKGDHKTATIPVENGVAAEREAAKMAKAEESKKPLTKSEILNAIAAETELTRKQVNAVFEALSGQIKKSLGNRGPGVFAIPGLVKIEKKKVPARPARKGVPNPFKPGELMDIAAKPASTKIKVRALKSLKDMV
jgi:nucleoid DNA-binding protein